MKKYFVTSDIHGFYDEFIEALTNSGFEKDNPEHVLIVCGDLFDRGEETIKLYNFIKSIPLERRILIRGNHEDLLKECILRNDFLIHDYRNGTVKTCFDFIDETLKKSPRYFKGVHSSEELETGKSLYFNDRREFFKRLNDLNIVGWIDSDEWVNYYELGKYIFVHGWIPVIESQIKDEKKLSFNENWRFASKEDWNNARWLNGMKMASEGLIEKDKTIVCGHWHCSYGNARKVLNKKNVNQDTEFSKLEYFKPFEDEGIIAIDACTAYTHKVNVLVIDEKDI